VERETRVSTPALRVAILAPMRTELRPLVAPLDLAESPEHGSGLLCGAVGRVEVVAALTGIGMRAGAKAAERMLEAAAPDHLVVVGIAGGIGRTVAVGDLVVPERVLNLDSGETLRPTSLGSTPARGTLASSDALLEDPTEAARLGDRGVVAIDMETAAIGAVCDARRCAWSVFRAISDRADDGTTDAAILGLTHPDGSPNPFAVARLILTRPRRIRQLVRLGRGAKAATRTAARAAVTALETL
jgi:adenosylhomocysteine nucleosidase